jgi:hypothetical protein
MTWSFGRAVITAAMALPVTGLRAAHAQEFKGPLWGGSGGTSTYNLDCGSTGVMVGLYGKAGMWIDQIGITCQTVNADGALGSTYTRGPVGGPGGTGANIRCNAGWAVRWMSTATGTYVDAIGLVCGPWSPSTRRIEGNYQFTSGLGTPGYLGILTGIKNNPYVQCPTEKVGKAVRGKYGSYIDSLQFVCDDYNK